MFTSQIHINPIPKFLIKKWITHCDGAPDQSKKSDDVTVDTHGGAFRFMGYFRAASLLVAKGARYLAYTSDVGEAFRPILHPRFVTLAYGMSWSYVIGDVAFHGYKQQQQGSDSKKIG